MLGKVNINTDFQKKQGQRDRLNCDITLFTYIYSDDIKENT